jgi:hypothetical protein
MVAGSRFAHAGNLRPMSELIRQARGDTPLSANDRGGQILAVVDRQTLDWGNNGIRSIRQVPTCWQRIGVLKPRFDAFAGRWLVALLTNSLRHLPAGIGVVPAGSLERRMTPLPADVYRVVSDCH